MSFEPRAIQGSAVREARAQAQRQARRLSGGLVALLGMGGALLMVLAFAVLDYGFDQDPHRVLKMLGGVCVVAGILMLPQFGLLALPVLMPLLGLLPKLPIPGVNALNILVFSVFISFAFARVLARESVFRRGRLDGWLFALVGLVGLSVLRGAVFPTGYGYDAAEAGIQWFRCSMTFTIYFIGMAMARRDVDQKRLVWAIVAGLAAEALFTISHGRNGRGGRAVGTFGQANDLGAYLAMFTVFSVAMLPAVRNAFGRLLLFAAGVAGATAVVMTVSRGAIVSLVVGLAFVAVRSSKLLTLVLAIVLVSSPLWTPDFVKDRVLGTQVEDELYDETTLESSSQLRVDTWRAIVDVVSNHPVDGVGFTGLGYVLPDIGSARGVQVKDSAHNTYLRFLGEMGIFGLGLFIVLLWKCWSLAAAARRAATGAFDRQLGLGLGAATLVLALCCAFGDRFFPLVITGNFWLLCALVNARLADTAARAA